MDLLYLYTTRKDKYGDEPYNTIFYKVHPDRTT